YGDAGQGRVDQEHADAVVAAARLRLGYDDQVVRDMRRAIVDLLAVENVGIAVAHSSQLDAGNVGAVVRLAQAQREAHVSGNDLGQHLALHRIATVQRDVHAGIDHGD